MPYTPEELQTLQEIRLANKKRYQHLFYINKTKPKREKEKLENKNKLI